MVSVGDTDISLHIPPWGVGGVCVWGGGGIMGKSKLKSAKICINFNFFGGGGGILKKSKLKSLKVPRSA